MKRFVGMNGPLITLAAALVVLFASLVALLAANSLRGQLQETQGQLEEARGQLKDTQGELQEAQEARDRQQKTASESPRSPVREPGAAQSRPRNDTKGESQEQKSAPPGGQDQQRAMLLQTDGGSFLPYLLLFVLALVVLASLALVLTSILSLLSGGSRLGRAGAAVSEAPVPAEPSHEEARVEPSNLEDEGPSEDGRWMRLVEECVEVVDELDEHMSSFDAPRREVAGHVVLRLEEVLARSGVEVISNDATFHRARHKPDSTHATTGNGVAVRETLSPGFAVGPRVLRRARVRLE